MLAFYTGLEEQSLVMHTEQDSEELRRILVYAHATPTRLMGRSFLRNDESMASALKERERGRESHHVSSASKALEGEMVSF